MQSDSVLKLEKKGVEFVRIRSPNSVIFFVLLYYADNHRACVLFDNEFGNNRKLLEIIKIAHEFTLISGDTLLSFLHSRGVT